MCREMRRSTILFTLYYLKWVTLSGLVKQKKNDWNKSMHEHDLEPFCMTTNKFGQLIKVCETHISGLPLIGGPWEDCKASVWSFI